MKTITPNWNIMDYEMFVHQPLKLVCFKFGQITWCLINWTCKEISIYTANLCVANRHMFVKCFVGKKELKSEEIWIYLRSPEL